MKHLFRIKNKVTNLYLGKTRYSICSKIGVLYSSLEQANLSLNESINNTKKKDANHKFENYDIEEIKIEIVKNHLPVIL